MQPVRHDVIVMGGGLAGLTLALQLRQRMPTLDLLVLDRRPHPVPVAAHKVGESTVEIGANYLDTVLGLREYLASHQLRKFGFRFFFSDGRSDFDRVLELGASRYLSTPGYQLDRGLLENHLGLLAQAQGVRFLHGATVRSFTLAVEGGGDHTVTYVYAGSTQVASARWLVDASGRAGLIKRHLGLAQENGHEANAAWFRIATRIDVNEWSDNAEWLARCTPPDRWLSTNHLVGAGYWVWLIPLSSGSHSVGIVADSAMHPSDTLNSFDKAMAWLALHQPRLAGDLETKRHLLQDFAYLRRFSYGCRRVFSGSGRWALTGEAGVFLDPFYSPGSDFIAIANTYISALIEAERSGEKVDRHAAIYERFYLSFYESTLTLYRGQYPLFGDPRVLPVKVIWDYSYYWGVLCQLFFQRRLTDIALLTRVRAELTASQSLNFAMQRLLQRWAQGSVRANPAAMLDQARMEWFAELNRGLRDRLDDVGFERRLRETTAQLRVLAGEIALLARTDDAAIDCAEVLELAGGCPGAMTLLASVHHGLAA